MRKTTQIMYLMQQKGGPHSFVITTCSMRTCQRWQFSPVDVRTSSTASSGEEENDSEPVLPPTPKRRIPLVFYSSSEDSENDNSRGNKTRPTSTSSETRSPLTPAKTTKWNPNQTTGCKLMDRMRIQSLNGLFALWNIYLCQFDEFIVGILDYSFIFICANNNDYYNKVLFPRQNPWPERTLPMAAPAGKRCMSD